MTDTIPPSAVDRWTRFRREWGLEKNPSGRPPFIWLERKNALIIMWCVVIGVPLMVLSGLSHETKKTILIAWLIFWQWLFIEFELRELNGQMLGRGSINQEQLSKQQETAQNPFYGCLISIALWAVVLAIHVTMNTSDLYAPSSWEKTQLILRELYRGLWTTPLAYGWVEWVLILHVWWAGGRYNKQIMMSGNTFNKAIRELATNVRSGA